MSLTASGVKSAKPQNKPYKLSDEKGLYLLVTPSGWKLWRFDYRFAEKRKTRPRYAQRPAYPFQ